MKPASFQARVLILFSLLLTAEAGRSAENPAQRLVVFHAGSLTVPFDRIVEAFKNENPGIEVVREIAGSRECARKISELHKPCDIFASADYMVIDTLLIPKFADWNLKFATNEMAIVFHDKSRASGEITAHNWFDILGRPDVAAGRADPNADPCGYRTILTLRLAEIYYRKPGLAAALMSRPDQHVRPKEVDLLALLESGEIDYIFLYRSVAMQHGLRYVTLPDQINLKNADFEDYYRQVSVELNGTAPGERIVQQGGSMVYGVTIPKGAPNPVTAARFLKFLMNRGKGLRIMEQMGQPTVVPSSCDTYDKLPAEFRAYAKKK